MVLVPSVRGYTPVHEVQSCLNICLICLVVYTPVVLCTGAETLVCLIASADIDRNHSQIIICKRAVCCQVSVLPGTILEEYCLACKELVSGVITGLCCKLLRITGAVVDVQIPDIAVVVKVGSLDCICSCPIPSA